MDGLEDLVQFLQTEILNSPSYEETLEQQKMAHLGQQQINIWKEIAADLKPFFVKLHEEDNSLQNVDRRTRFLAYKLENVEAEVQDLLNDGTNHILQRHRSEVRQRLQRKGTRRVELAEKKKKIREEIVQCRHARKRFEESKSQALINDMKQQRNHAKAEYDVVYSEVAAILKAKRQREQACWDKSKLLLVELADNQVGIAADEKAIELYLQNNELMLKKIEKMKENIELAKIKAVEDAKRREKEFHDQLLTPVQLAHAEFHQAPFKNPNDFPFLIEKIGTRRTKYKHIFKRPRCVNLQNEEKLAKRFKARAALQAREMFRSFPPFLMGQSQERLVETVQGEKESTAKSKAGEPPKSYQRSIDTTNKENIKGVKRSSSTDTEQRVHKKTKLHSSQRIETRTESIKADDSLDDERSKTSKREILISKSQPLSSSEVEKVKKVTKEISTDQKVAKKKTFKVMPSRKRDVSPDYEDQTLSNKSNKQPNLNFSTEEYQPLRKVSKRDSCHRKLDFEKATEKDDLHKSKPISSKRAMVPQSAKKATQSQEHRHEEEQNEEMGQEFNDKQVTEVIMPPCSQEKQLQREPSEPMILSDEDQQDENISNAAPARVSSDEQLEKNTDQSDSLSLQSSILSFELDNQETSSDLGFELSPVQSAGSSGELYLSAGNGSDDNMDLDFLGNPTPKQKGSQQPSQKQKVAGGRSKKSDNFDFFGNSGDSGSFDFF
ncbi:trichohyalin-like [Uranotaenia lowii]|uniref:trichohyalin-like n=1 Tax=Uranotaenia lowii TaxID=190385 RepID=UPI00247AD1FE|nr:trichohyalin-like [Uranotaenia lowii]XP_055609323.1 trichohyalin-like [Uranotaenia lowii]